MNGLGRLALVALGGMLVLLGVMGASTSSAAQVLVATPTATMTATVAYTVTVVRNANLRAGPATSYAVVGSAKIGQSLVVTGSNPAGDWLQLVDGKWVAAFLVEKATAVPVGTVAATATSVPGKTPSPTPKAIPATVTPAPPTVAPTVAPAPGGCAGGCVEPPAGCEIKGNVNSEGERIYHTPSSSSYSRTKVKPEEGDRWFCTEAEALAAGFRAPRN